jgi:AraC family transcriptional regulator, carnitine catabolism transcriptional activator
LTKSAIAEAGGASAVAFFINCRGALSGFTPYRIGFLLLPDFSQFGLLAAVQPLFLANWRAQRTLFSWLALSADGLAVRASNGTSVAVDAALGSRQQLQTLLVMASFDPKQHAGETRLRSALRRVAGAGVEIGGIETGSELVAAAGLLDGRSAAVHWENHDGFSERYPQVAARKQLYHAEPGRLTCAGGTAVIDMMLYLVARECGKALAEEVAREMLMGPPRPPTRRQLTEPAPEGLTPNALVRAAAALMRRNLDEPLSIEDIARRLKVSPRHLRRQFRQFTATTAAHHYMTLRLSRAHNLLEQTDLSVTEIAVTCGFRSLEHFSRVYRTAFGCAPSADRRQIIGAPLLRPHAGPGARARGHRSDR